MNTIQQQVQIFTSADGQAQLEVALEQDTVWLSQAQMCELFGRERSVITKHIRNVFQEGELEQDAVCANFAHTAADGKTYQTQYYNLDVIISVGYRVKSPRGVQFRQWATRVLRQHLVDDYTLNQRRLQEHGIEFEQGFGDELFCPNVASRAVHLLYFAIMYRTYGMRRMYGYTGSAKNHPLKHTGSFLFLWYLRLNQHLLLKQVEHFILLKADEEAKS